MSQSSIVSAATFYVPRSWFLIVAPFTYCYAADSEEGQRIAADEERAIVIVEIASQRAKRVAAVLEASGVPVPDPQAFRRT